MQKKIKMKAWQGLKQGDVVDLVAPGFRSGQEELRSAEEFIRSWGLVPRVPQGIFGDDVLSSNSDEARFQMLKSALTAPDSRAVWCLRGGYGSIRLLPDLLKLKKPAGDAKLFLALSDITSIHLFLNQNSAPNKIMMDLDKELDALRNELVITKGDNYVGAGEPKLREKLGDVYINIVGYYGAPSSTQLENMAMLKKQFEAFKSKFEEISKNQFPAASKQLTKSKIQQPIILPFTEFLKIEN